MKKILYTTAALMLAGFAAAQVSIGKEEVNGTSTLLDFDDSANNYRGIILPAVEAPASAVNGTFVFDKEDEIVKMYENGDWVFLSDAGDGSSIAENTSEEVGGGAIIGAETSSAEGVLVLESADKAMILPKIANPHETVKSPYPGMMCYDTTSKTLAVFDGSVWNYWK